LLLPLDVANTHEDTNINMYMFWYIVYMSSLFYICVVLPYGLYFSEADEEKEFKWRICSAFKNEIITLVIISLFLFPSFAYMKYSYIPVTAHTCNASATISPFVDATADVTMEDVLCKTIEAHLKITVGFQIYVITVMCFLGWLMLCFFLPTGLWAYPFDLIGKWVQRPKPMREDEFNRSKFELAAKV